MDLQRAYAFRNIKIRASPNRNLPKAAWLIGDINKKFTNRLPIFLEKNFPKWYNIVSIRVKSSEIEDKGVKNGYF